MPSLTLLRQSLVSGLFIGGPYGLLGLGLGLSWGLLRLITLPHLVRLAAPGPSGIRRRPLTLQAERRMTESLGSVALTVEFIVNRIQGGSA